MCEPWGKLGEKNWMALFEKQCHFVEEIWILQILPRNQLLERNTSSEVM